MPVKPQTKPVTVAEASRRLGLSSNEVRSLVRDGELQLTERAVEARRAREVGLEPDVVFLSQVQAATLLEVSQPTISYYLRTGKLRRWKTTRWVDRASVDAILEFRESIRTGDLLTLQEIVRRTHLSMATVRDYVRMGLLKSEKTANTPYARRTVKWADFVAWAGTQEKRPGQPYWNLRMPRWDLQQSIKTKKKR